MALEWSYIRNLRSYDGKFINLFLLIADAFFHLDAPVTRVTGLDIPTPYAFNLEDLTFPKTHSIVKAVRTCLNAKI